MDPYNRNPFRVLGVPSAASPRDIAKASDRLLKWIELDESPTVDELLPYLEPCERTREAVKQSERQIGDPQKRIELELFWPSAENSHYQACCAHLKRKQYAEFISLCEYAIAKVGLPEGRVAASTAGRQDAALSRHFLAVFHHSAALSNLTAAPGKSAVVRGFADWERAFQYWTMVWRDDVFWEYLGKRARSLNDQRLAGFDIGRLRSDLPQLLLGVNASLGEAALNQHRLSEFAASARVIRKSPFSQGEQERALKKLAAPILSQFEEALKVVAPKLSENAAREAASTMRQRQEGGFESTIDPDKFNSYYSALESSIYKNLIPLGELIKRADLAVVEGARDALDSLAYALRRLSLTLNNVGDRPQKALEITRIAKGFAKSLECTRTLLEDETALQFLILQKEAIEAANAKQFDKALLKLEESRKYATPEEQKTVDEWIEATKKRAVLGNAKPITSAPTMYTFNGIGTTLYGRRGFDKATDTYISTLFFVVLFIPIFPIAAYRVRHVGGNQYQFFGKVPLTKWAFLPLAVFACLILYANISASTNTASSSNGNSSTPGSTTSPSKGSDGGKHSPEKPAAKKDLSTWLDQEEVRLKAGKSQLEEMRSEIDREGTLLDAQYNSLGDSPTEDEVNSYKLMENRFNAKVRRYENLRGSYNASVDKFKSEVDRYNSMP